MQKTRRWAVLSAALPCATSQPAQSVQSVHLSCHPAPPPPVTLLRRRTNSAARNQPWPVFASLLHDNLPQTISGDRLSSSPPERASFCLSHPQLITRTSDLFLPISRRVVTTLQMSVTLGFCWPFLSSRPLLEQRLPRPRLCFLPNRRRIPLWSSEMRMI